MPVQSYCEACGQVFSASRKYLNRRVRCPKCGKGTEVLDSAALNDLIESHLSSESMDFIVEELGATIPPGQEAGAAAPPAAAASPAAAPAAAPADAPPAPFASMFHRMLDDPEPVYLSANDIAGMALTGIVLATMVGVLGAVVPGTVAVLVWVLLIGGGLCFLYGALWALAEAFSEDAQCGLKFLFNPWFAMRYMGRRKKTFRMAIRYQKIGAMLLVAGPLAPMVLLAVGRQTLVGMASSHAAVQELENSVREASGKLVLKTVKPVGPPISYAPARGNAGDGSAADQGPPQLAGGDAPTRYQVVQSVVFDEQHVHKRVLRYEIRESGQTDSDEIRVFIPTGANAAQTLPAVFVPVLRACPLCAAPNRMQMSVGMRLAHSGFAAVEFDVPGGRSDAGSAAPEVAEMRRNLAAFQDARGGATAFEHALRYVQESLSQVQSSQLYCLGLGPAGDVGLWLAANAPCIRGVAAVAPDGDKRAAVRRSAPGAWVRAVPDLEQIAESYSALTVADRLHCPVFLCAASLPSGEGAGAVQENLPELAGKLRAASVGVELEKVPAGADDDVREAAVSAAILWLRSQVGPNRIPLSDRNLAGVAVESDAAVPCIYPARVAWTCAVRAPSAGPRLPCYRLAGNVQSIRQLKFLQADRSWVAIARGPQAATDRRAADGTRIALVNLDSGTEIEEGPSSGPRTLLDAWPEKKWIVVADADRLRIRDCLQKTDVVSWPLSSGVQSDSVRAALIDGETLLVWEPGRPVVALKIPQQQVRFLIAEEASAVCLSPDRQHLAVWSLSQGHVRGSLYSTRDGTPLGNLALAPTDPAAQSLAHVGFSPLHRAAAAVCANELLVWDVTTGEVRSRLPGASADPIWFLDETTVLNGSTLFSLANRRRVGHMHFAPDSLQFRTACVEDSPNAEPWALVGKADQSYTYLLPLKPDVQRCLRNITRSGGEWEDLAVDLAPSSRRTPSAEEAGDAISATLPPDDTAAPASAAAEPPREADDPARGSGFNNVAGNRYLRTLALDDGQLMQHCAWWPIADHPATGLCWGVGLIERHAQPGAAQGSDAARLQEVVAFLKRGVTYFSGSGAFQVSAGKDQPNPEVAVHSAADRAALRTWALSAGLEAVAVVDRKAAGPNEEIDVEFLDTVENQVLWSTTLRPGQADASPALLPGTEFRALVKRSLQEGFVLKSEADVRAAAAVARLTQLQQVLARATEADRPWLELRGLLEARYYMARGCVARSEGVRMCTAILGENDGDRLLRGSPEARRAVLETHFCRR